MCCRRSRNVVSRWNSVEMLREFENHYWISAKTNIVRLLSGANPSSLTSAPWLILLTAESSGTTLTPHAIWETEGKPVIRKRELSRGDCWKRGGSLFSGSPAEPERGQEAACRGLASVLVLASARVTTWAGCVVSTRPSRRGRQPWSSFPISTERVITPTSRQFTYIILKPAAASCCSLTLQELEEETDWLPNEKVLLQLRLDSAAEGLGPLLMAVDWQKLAMEERTVNKLCPACW